jgi:glycosyltransferase involved in cell wall biosynthesis
MPSTRFGRKTMLVEAVARFVARRADTVRVVSLEIAKEAADAGVRPGRIALVPSRCDTELFDPSRWREAGNALRSSFQGDSTLPVVGFLGSFNLSKGLDVLVTAACKLEQRRAFRLAVAGDGPLRRELDHAAVRAILPITVLGRLPTSDVPRFLAAIDVLAVPSRDEGLPRVVLEAMAMRVPVVASNVGGIPEAVEAGRSGLLVPPDDPDALAAALARVLEDETLASSLGEAGRRRVLDDFDARVGWARLAALHATEPLFTK